MTNLVRTELEAAIAADLPDNTSQDITASRLRSACTDLNDTIFREDAIALEDKTGRIMLEQGGYLLKEIATVGIYGTDFAMLFTTTGSSETVDLGCRNAGTFNAVIDWGDDSTSDITSYNDADLAHIYADAGDYDVRISGTFPNIAMNYSTTGKVALKKIYQLGSVGFVTLLEAFSACPNLTDAAALVDNAVNNVSGCENMRRMFFSDTGLINPPDCSNWITTSLNDISEMFLDCTSMTTAPDVSGWDVSNVLTMQGAFNNCPLIATALIADNWDTSSVTNMSYMFLESAAIPDIYMDGWDIESVTNFTSFLNASSIPTARYDATLIAWDAQNPVDGLAVDFGGSTYTAGGAAATARASLESTDSWTITDGGTA